MRTYGDTAIFVQVARVNGFTRAAQTLMLTPSAISKAVTRLERRLGARLIVRSTRSLRLTELGVEYFERCKDALEQIARADTTVSDASMHGTGALRIEMPTTIGRHVVMPALAQFLVQNSSVRLEVMLRDLPSDLFRSDVDAAVCIGPLAASELIACRVGEVRRTTCATPSFIERNGAPRTPSDLIPQQCLALIDPQTGRPEPWTFARGGIKRTIVPGSQLMLGDTDAAISAAACGLGYVQAPSLSVRHHMDAGRVQPVLSDWDDDASLPVYIVFPRHRQQSLKIKAFTEFLKALLSHHARTSIRALPMQPAGPGVRAARRGESFRAHGRIVD